MKRRNRDINIFGLSMMNTMTCALGAFVVICLVLIPYYTKYSQAEKELSELGTQMSTLGSKNGVLEAKIKEIIGKINEKGRKVEDLQNIISDLDKIKLELQLSQEEIDKTNIIISNLESKIKAKNDELAIMKEELEKSRKKNPSDAEKLGFGLKDKNLIFVLDMSESMKELADGIPKFKKEISAIKMMIAMLDNSYRIDIVVFPATAYIGADKNITTKDTYAALYGELRVVSDDRKYKEIYTFLNSLDCSGGTPMKETLGYIFENKRHYGGATSVIMMTDGMPDEIERAIGDEQSVNATISSFNEELLSKNDTKKKIVIFGIGTNYMTTFQANEEIRKKEKWYRILKELSEKSKGFFVAF